MGKKVYTCLVNRKEDNTGCECSWPPTGRYQYTTHHIMTAQQKKELTSAIAELLRHSSNGDRIYDCGFAVTVNAEDGDIDCSSIYEADGRVLLTADAIIAYVGGTDDAEAWAAANPEDAAVQYVETHRWELDAAIDRLMSEV